MWSLSSTLVRRSAGPLRLPRVRASDRKTYVDVSRLIRCHADSYEWQCTSICSSPRKLFPALTSMVCLGSLTRSHGRLNAQKFIRGEGDNDVVELGTQALDRVNASTTRNSRVVFRNPAVPQLESVSTSSHFLAISNLMTDISPCYRQVTVSRPLC